MSRLLFAFLFLLLGMMFVNNTLGLKDAYVAVADWVEEGLASDIPQRPQPGTDGGRQAART